MTSFLNRLQERILVQKNHLISDREGGYKEEWQDVGYLWVARDSLYPGRRRMSAVNQGHRLGAQHLDGAISLFVARQEIPIKAGMRLRGDQVSYTVLEDAENQDHQGWQQFCGVVLKAHERGA